MFLQLAHLRVFQSYFYFHLQYISIKLDPAHYEVCLDIGPCVCELLYQVLARKQRNRKIPICLDFQGGEGAINHAPDKKVFNYPYFRCA